MKPVIHKSFLMILILLILLVIIPSLLYYHYQTQFSYDVINLENRSGIHLIQNQPAIKAFYATNRLAKSGEFTNQESKTLSYGISFIQIPRQYHFGGSFEKKLLQDAPLDENDFFKKLRIAVNTSESKLLILWVHGYANSFEGTASVLARGAYDLNTEATYVFFSWPSKNKWFSYQADEVAEEDSAPLFASFLKQLKEEIPEAKIVIIAHSLGTRLLCDALDILYTYKNWNDSDKEIQNIILIAPDVDEDDFNQLFKRQILAITKRLTVYVASDDGALLISHFKYGKNPLGLPAQFSSDTQLDETQALLALMAPELNLDIVDATYIIKPSFFSHSYYRSRAIISDIYWLLNKHEPTERQLYRSKLRKNLNYWVIPP